MLRQLIVKEKVSQVKQFSDATQKIIDAHKSDFNCTNYISKLRAYGGYSAYLNSLGGVFKKWNGKTASVKTVEELHEIAEYVFGLMSIFGFDYNNGTWYRKWAGGSPFYINNQKGRCNWGRIDDLCGKESKDKTTNCNYGMDSLLYKAGLYGGNNQPTNSCAYKSHIKSRKCPFFRNQKDLQIGDLIQFFRNPVTTNNCDDWSDWGHVAIVGDIVNGNIILFDSGGRFITTGNYKHEFKVDKNNKPIGDYDTYKGWVAIRDFTLVGAKNDSIKNRSDSALAVGVIHAEYGSGNDRKNLLGNRYSAVQKLVNHYLSSNGHNDYIRACADFVLSGYAGSGETRKAYFGNIYNEVQNKVNWVIKTAEEVINNKYGVNETRKQLLGDEYTVVQNQVNRMLKK